MGNIGWLSGQIAKLITNKRRSRIFWNIFYSCFILLFVIISSYFIIQTINGSIEIGITIAMFALFLLPATAFFVFMIIITNIKNPNDKIKKIQKEFLII